MDLDNLVKTIVHYHLLGRMDCFDCQNGFLMVSALACMITHWTKPTLNHDARLSIVMIHQPNMLHGL